MSFTTEELQALYELIDQLSGGNPGNVFAHDGSDSLEDLTTSTAVKLYWATGNGHLIPTNLKESMG